MPPAEWQLPEMQAWPPEQVAALLDRAQAVLTTTAEALRMPARAKRPVPVHAMCAHRPPRRVWR